MPEGVAPEAIHTLNPPIVNTADEIKVIAPALAPGQDDTVILVTTKAHTRRVRLLWRRLAPGQGRAIVRAASGDPFDRLEEHTSELQSQSNLVCRLLLEKKKKMITDICIFLDSTT